VILGIGIDIVDIGRIEALRKRYGMRFLARVFTPEEIAACNGRYDAASCLAGRFAAKEAAFKALAVPRSSGISFQDISVGSSNGLPQLRLTGKALKHALSIGVVKRHLSISHDRGCAVAMVILENA
jgi:holo-[acyl-carrier protein] synthase